MLKFPLLGGFGLVFATLGPPPHPARAAIPTKLRTDSAFVTRVSIWVRVLRAGVSKRENIINLKLWDFGRALERKIPGSDPARAKTL
jgi:hypothetical protein